MPKVELITVKPFKGRAEGDRFTTSLNNSRALVADGTAKAIAPARKAAAKKAPARKAPAKKAATKRVYQARALKAK